VPCQWDKRNDEAQEGDDGEQWVRNITRHDWGKDQFSKALRERNELEGGTTPLYEDAASALFRVCRTMGEVDGCQNVVLSQNQPL
jgi:hypothetical protein